MMMTSLRPAQRILAVLTLLLTTGPATAGVLTPTSLNNSNQPFHDLGVLSIASGGTFSTSSSLGADTHCEWDCVYWRVIHV